MKLNSEKISTGQNKSSLWRGTLLCAGFTFRQQWKIKANLISFLILLVFSIAMPYLAGFGDDLDFSTGLTTGKVIYLDGIGYGSPDFEQLKDDYDGLENVEFEYITADRQSAENSGSFSKQIVALLRTLGPDELLVTVNEYDGSPVVNLTRSSGTAIPDSDLLTFSDIFESVVTDFIIEEKEISTETADKISGGIYLEQLTQADYEDIYGTGAAGTDESMDQVPDAVAEEEAEDEMDSYDQFSLQFPFSIVIMMICMMASSFIIREVVTEKTSKLVDTLLVGMKAQSLLFGKILGILGFVISMAVGIAAAFGISDVVRMNLTGQSVIASFFESYGKTLGEAGADVLLVLVVCTVLGILVFSVLTGLIGAGCSSEEDASAALGLPMIFIMAAYMISLLAASFDGAWVKILSIVPMVSTFMVPVQYLCGGISLPMVALSWLLQGAVAALLIWISGTVYSNLLIYRGSRIGLGKIVRMAFPKRKEARR